MKKTSTSLQTVMFFLAGICTALCLLFAVINHVRPSAWAQACAISFGTTDYHIFIRLMSPVLLKPIFHRRYDPNSHWFRQKPWEPRFYALLHVQQWKKHVPTYDSSQFSLAHYTLDEIVLNMCHAEAVHELIFPLALASLLFAIPFGQPWVFAVTGILSASVELIFIFVQRYNRPRIAALAARHAAHRRA